MNNKIKVEFHVHTKYSLDSYLDKYMLLIMCKIKGIDCIAITDHNEIEGAFCYKTFLEKHGVLVIVGEEIFTKKGEVIGLFLTEKIEPNMSVNDTIKAIKRQEGLVYVPHPYDTKRKKSVLDKAEIEAHFSEIDMIEVHNGRNIIPDFSEKQNSIANHLNICKVIGSDAHVFFELGRNYVELEYFATSIDLSKNLSQAKFHKKPCLLLAHQITKIVKGLKILFSGGPYELFRVVYKKFKKKKL